MKLLHPFFLPLFTLFILFFMQGIHVFFLPAFHIHH